MQAERDNENGAVNESAPPVKREPPVIRHAFLKRVLLVSQVLVVNILIYGLGYGALLFVLAMFFVPASSAWSYAIRQVILVVGTLVLLGPIYAGRALISHDDKLGESTDENRQPLLFGIMTEAATAVGAYPVRHVKLRPDAIMAIDLGRMSLSPGLRRPKLHIGLAGLIGFTIHELKANLAHEHAHLRLGKGWTGPFIRFGMAQLSAIFAVFFNNPLGRLTRVINPFYWLFRLLAAGIGPWGEEVMKWHEYQADISAGRIYGSAAVVASQQKGLINSFAFEMAVGKARKWLTEKKIRVDDIIGYAGRIREMMDETDERQILARGEVLIGRFDATHPSPASRAEAVEEFECKIDADSRPAMEVIKDADEIRAKLTDKFYKAMAKHEKLVLEGAETTPAAELPLSYTGAELDNILDKFIADAGKKGLSLNYDRESLERADRHFAKHPEFFMGPPGKDVVGDIILYLGETIRRLHGGEWVFPVVSPPKLVDVGPEKRTLEVYEVFMSELAAANYPSVMPAYIRSLERLGIREEGLGRSPTGGPGTVL